MRDENRENRRNFESPDNPFGAARPTTNGVNGRNGAHPTDMQERSVPMKDMADPIDLVAVQADDELISALAAGMSVSAPGFGGYDADDHVAAILAAWKAEVDTEPVPELVDLDSAMAALVAGRPRSSRVRHLAPVAAAAAFIVLAIGGVSVGSSTSEPGDALWGVSKVLYSERAESLEAVARAETHITKAKQALAAGQPEVAAQELQQAEADLVMIRPEEGLVEIAAVQDFLEAKAEETPVGVASDPGAPLVSDRTRRVPPGAAITPDTEVAVSVPPASSSVPVEDVPDPDPIPPSGPTNPRTAPKPVFPLPAPTTATTTVDPLPTTTPEPSPSPTPEPVVEVPPVTTDPGPSDGGVEGGAQGSVSSSPTASGLDVPASGTS